MSLKSFAVVLIGDSFPVSSIRLSDFEFRRRSFRETLRIGSALQAQSRGVELLIVANRFSLTVTELDDLDVQTAGAREVVDQFQQYVGGRTLTALGNNAQMSFAEPVTAQRLFGRLFREDEVRPALGATEPGGKATWSFPGGAGAVVNVSVAADDPAETLVDVNFHYDLTDAMGVAEAVGQLRACVQSAVEIGGRIEALVRQEEPVS
jgi:hypothetical protein